jgi:hypothetical protein
VLVTEERMTKARTTSPLTRNQKKKMSEVPSKVKLRKIVPEVPRGETKRGELLEDLQVMGCSGFLEKPWGFKDDRIVRELLDGVSNEFDNLIRGQPVRWTEKCSTEVYRFGKGGGGLAGRKDEYVKGCFKDLPTRRTDTRSTIARIHGTGGCSHSLSPLYIRENPTGLLLLGVTRSSAH